MQEISSSLLEWFDAHGRKDLPWQKMKSAYRVWISEIMLQQTQVKTVIPYFLRFMERFPDVSTLSLAPEDEVFSLWSGLGYYQRARNLQKTARVIVHQYQGQFPNNLESLIQLPGIGPSTAAAIASIAFNQPTAILDGNVARVLSRHFLIDGAFNETQVKRKLWALANQCMPKQRCADYTQAIMDLGATCCTVKKPLCHTCPLTKTCLAKLEEKVELYPFKKPKIVRPVKAQQFLLLHTQANLIYLEKRPATGIWGGLWCLPSIEIGIDTKAHIQNAYDLQYESQIYLLSMKHIFTHFQLYITASAFLIKEQIVESTIGRWFKQESLSQLGLPKPISKIIDTFYAHCETNQYA